MLSRLKHIIYFIAVFSYILPGYGQEISFIKPESENLQQPFVYSIVRDNLGFYYFGTGLGVTKSDGRNFKPVPAKNDERVFCKSMALINEKLWVGSNKGDIYILKNDTLVPLYQFEAPVIKIFSSNNTTYILTPLHLYRITNDTPDQIVRAGSEIFHDAIINDNKIYIASSSSLYVHKPNGSIITILPEINPRKFTQKNNSIYALGQSKLWVLKNDKWEEQITDNFLLQSPGDIALDVFNRLWISDRSGLYLMDIKEGKWSVNSLEDCFEVNSLGTGSVYIINNHVWIGTLGYGLYYFDLSDYFSMIPLGNVQAITPYENNSILAATTRGIYSISLEGDFKFKSQLIWSRGGVTALCYQKPYLFVGDKKGLVTRWNISDRGVENLKLLSMNRVAPILNISQSKFSKNLWVTQSLEGAYLVTPSLNIFKKWDTTNGLLHNEVFKVIADKKGRTWFLTQASGLMYLQDEKFKYIGLNEGLKTLDFTDITESNPGEIIITSMGGGFLFIDENGNMSEWTQDQGLPNNYLFGIETINQNTLLTYSRKEYYEITPKKTTIYSQFPDELFLKERCMLQTGGFTVVGSNTGLLIHHKKPEIYKKDSLLLVWEKATSDITGNVNSDQQLKYGNHKLTFDFAFTHPSPTHSVSLQYKMEGFDKEWQPLFGGTINYQSIKDGEYILKVREQENTKNEISFPFSIDIPIWKRADFFILTAFVLIFLVVFISRYRSRQLIRQNTILEEAVEMRTTQLQQKNKELEQFTFAISHDLKNPVNNLNELIKMFTSNFPSENKIANEFLKKIEKASGKVQANLLDFLNLLKMTQEENLTTDNVDIAGEIESVMESLSHQIEKEGAKIRKYLKKFASIQYNKTQLQSILYNLISNSIKYRKATEKPVVTVTSFIEDGYYGISIKDNGLGMDLKKDEDKLFAPFQRIHTHTEGTGLGLALVNSIIVKNGGYIQVKSELGKGTEFKLFLVKQQIIEVESSIT